MGKTSVTRTVAARNSNNVTIDIKKLNRFAGRDLNFSLLRVRKENSRGKSVYEMITTVEIPRIETMAIDLSAGCCANINTPTPTTVVIADKRMDSLYGVRL